MIKTVKDSYSAHYDSEELPDYISQHDIGKVSLSYLCLISLSPLTSIIIYYYIYYYE